MTQLRNLNVGGIESLDLLIDRISELREKHRLDLHDTLLAYVTLCPFVVAAQYVKSQFHEREEADRKLDHVANFLWMTKGVIYEESEIRDFQTALILPMDDPDNPSLSALTLALKNGDELDALREALKEHVGPLHHGAGTLAMAMFEEIKEPDRVHEYLRKRLESGNKIFGLGHRIYSGLDPRAIVLRGVLEKRARRSGLDWLIQVSDAVAREGRKLLADYKGIDAYPNIDLYNAAVFFTFGYPAELNTSLFAISRAAGWMAHILELKSG